MFSTKLEWFTVPSIQEPIEWATKPASPTDYQGCLLWTSWPILANLNGTTPPLSPVSSQTSQLQLAQKLACEENQHGLLPTATWGPRPLQEMWPMGWQLHFCSLECQFFATKIGPIMKRFHQLAPAADLPPTPIPSSAHTVTRKNRLHLLHILGWHWQARYLLHLQTVASLSSHRFHNAFKAEQGHLLPVQSKHVISTRERRHSAANSLQFLPQFCTMVSGL